MGAVGIPKVKTKLVRKKSQKELKRMLSKLYKSKTGIYDKLILHSMHEDSKENPIVGTDVWVLKKMWEEYYG